MKASVSIIIVNFNGKSVLSDCLRSLRKQTFKAFEIIVVDNNSSDGSVELVKSKFPNVRIVQKLRNLGFAQGNNEGYKYAKGKYILLLNNDTVVPDDLLEKLVGFIKNENKIGVVQPRIIMKNEKTLQSGCAFFTWTGFLYYFGYAKNPRLKKYNRTMDMFSANGSCMIVRRELIERVGFFDKNFFAYFEETDFCWRVHLSGYRVVYYPGVSIEHIGGVTSSRMSSNFVLFHSYKNRIMSLIKNLGLLRLMIILPMHIVLIELSSIGYLFFGRSQAIYSMNKAIVWNLLNLRKTLKLRKIIQKNRILNDGELMPIILGKVRISYFYYLFVGLHKYHD